MKIRYALVALLAVFGLSVASLILNAQIAPAALTTSSPLERLTSSVRLWLTTASLRGIPVPAYLKSKELSTNATTLVQAGAGVLGCVSVTVAGAGGNSLTLYNSFGAISGYELMTLDTTAKFEWCFGSLFSGALTATLGTGTAAHVVVTWQGQ